MKTKQSQTQGEIPRQEFYVPVMRYLTLVGRGGGPAPTATPSCLDSPGVYTTTLCPSDEILITSTTRSSPPRTLRNSRHTWERRSRSRSSRKQTSPEVDMLATAFLVFCLVGLSLLEVRGGALSWLLGLAPAPPVSPDAATPAAPPPKVCWGCCRKCVGLW